MGRYSRLDWEDLHFFAHVVQAKSLAGAARSLGVDHSTVSRRLAALERTVGAPLVIRGPGGLRLTPLAESIAPMVEALANNVQAIAQTVSTQCVRVRLALPTGFAKFFASELTGLQKRAPNIALEFLSGARNVDIDKGEADLALRIGTINQPHLIARRLCTVGSSLYAAPGYLYHRSAPADLHNLSGHTLIGYDPSLGALPAAQWIEQRAANATIVMRNREMTEMTSAAVNGAGLALIPCLLGDAEPGLVRLSIDVLTRVDLWLVYRREARLPGPLRTVIDFVIAVLQAHKNEIEGIDAPVKRTRRAPSES